MNEPFHAINALFEACQTALQYLDRQNGQVSLEVWKANFEPMQTLRETMAKVNEMPCVIRNRDWNNEFWSNKDGWVDLTDATLFTYAETKTLNLPMRGEWMPFESP